MRKLPSLILISLLSACGMKGDLVLPDAGGTAAGAGETKPADDAAPPVESPEEEAAKRQGVNPPSADPNVDSP